MKALTKAPDIEELRLFDSCVTLGRVTRSGTPEWLTPENVLEVMDKYDIAEALVHSNEARMIAPRDVGNRRLLEWTVAVPRLHPEWVLTPPEPSDGKAARAVVEEMLAEGVRAARLLMGYAPPFHWLWRDLCEALEEHRVPAFLDFASTGWGPPFGSTASVPDAAAIDGLREICLAHPGLPMILSNCVGGLGLAYPTLPLMRLAPNLHIDITAVLQYWRTAATELGPERVLFATGMPFTDPGTYVSNVQYAHEIDGEAKRMISAGNLRRLLAEVRP